MSPTTNTKRFERPHARSENPTTAPVQEEHRHHEARQRHLAHTPEGTEPTPRVRRMSWTLFGATVAAALVIMLVVLAANGGWKAAVLGGVAVIAMYFIMFWPDYAAWALRAKDKRDADRKIESGTPPPDDTPTRP